MSEMNKLPKTLSGLLRLAVRDCQAIEKDPHYTLVMDTWHSPFMDKCEVCMAGAVMANTLKFPPTKKVLMTSLMLNQSRDVTDALKAIDFMRTGAIITAFNLLNGTAFIVSPTKEILDAMDRAERLIDSHIDDDEDVPDERAPWEIYLQAADILEKVGL